MSAHCNKCGSDLVYNGTGEDWQSMTCPLCAANARAERAEQDVGALSTRVEELLAERDEALELRSALGRAEINMVRNAMAAETRCAQLEAVLRGLVEWADDLRGDDFGTREWADARAALSEDS